MPSIHPVLVLTPMIDPLATNGDNKPSGIQYPLEVSGHTQFVLLSVMMEKKRIGHNTGPSVT